MVIHPGPYIRENVIPAKMAVKDAAKLLAVGRPALSNLLNGKAALSSEMASRLEKAFGVDAQKLLKMQADFDQFQQREITNGIPVGAYVPLFLKITATQIEGWADENLDARSHLSVLLRKLVNSTGQQLSFVDFPGYDQAEKKGWDGRLDASAATPWIPLGESGWEFGCNGDPKGKAEKDYAQRVKGTPSKERAEMHFVFVTPRRWSKKETWRKEKESLKDWKSVRTYDAGDLEQWLEQSLQAQRWLSEKLGFPSDGVYSIDELWHTWSSVTDPELPKELFAPSVEHFTGIAKTWIESPPANPLIICGDSKVEALAFIYCLFEQDDPAFGRLRDRLLVFSSGQALRKLTTQSPTFVPVVFADEAERELGGEYKNRHVIIVRPRNTVDPGPTIILDPLSYTPFGKAMEAMGIIDHLRVNELGHASGYSPTILRRRLSKVPAIRTPDWAQNSPVVRRLIPMMLVGAWHTNSKGDCEIMSYLAGKSCDQVEKDVAELLKFDDPPIWAAGSFRGVSSKIDAFFAVQADVTQKDLIDFFFAAEIILSEKDPALKLPEDKRAFADIYGKSRDHSAALRDGVCETLVLLAVHSDNLFAKRLGLDVRAHVDGLIRRLLLPLAEEKLLSQNHNLPQYAEAAPQEFLQIIEDDLKSANPEVYALMKPTGSGVFSSPSRTGLLWALETLAWKPDQLLRVCFVLARLSGKKIEDNWLNKPEHSLQAIFRSWMPQTAAGLEERLKALEALVARFPAIGWEVCVSQFASGPHMGTYSQRPRWRNDASGVGQRAKTRDEVDSFQRKALDLALAWPLHNDKTLGDLVENLEGIAEEFQEVIWNLVDNWARNEHDEGRKAALREKIRRWLFTRRPIQNKVQLLPKGSATKQDLTSTTRDRARAAYALLTPTDVVTRNQWLFEQDWIHNVLDDQESEDFDSNKQFERLRTLRVHALQEIWRERGFEGLVALLTRCAAASTIGWHMAEGIIPTAETAGLVRRILTLETQDHVVKADEMLRGFLGKIESAVRVSITEESAKVLPPPLLCRILKCSPFQHETWTYVDAQESAVRERYWSDVHTEWLNQDSPDINEVIDRLLDVKRPRAAFFSVQFVLHKVETSRLRRLLHEIGTCIAAESGRYQIDVHWLSQALNILQNRTDVSEEDMARLEFLFISALKYTGHGIPNIEKQVGKSPSLFIQALALLYRRTDGLEDPPEWTPKDSNLCSTLATAAYRLLSNIKRVPGTDDAGKIDEVKLMAWVREVQSLCKQYGRVKVGDQKIGELLSSSTIVGMDGTWPCEQVRNVLEECGTPDMSAGVQVAVYNSRGVHFRGEGGGQERAISDQYRRWSKKLAYKHPYVSSVAEAIARTYEQEAEREDSDAIVRKRLMS